jgi:hypothetical protein
LDGTQRRVQPDVPVVVAPIPSAVDVAADAVAGVGRDPYMMTAGEFVYPRLLATAATAAVTSQGLFISYFQAKRTETVTQVTLATDATAAAATPTLCRMGVYSVPDATALATHTLIASTANDTTLFATTNTSYTKAFSASFTKSAGQWYGVAVLVVSGAALPTFRGLPHAANNSTNTWAPANYPPISGSIAGQADLPATYASNTVAAVTRAIQFRLH